MEAAVGLEREQTHSRNRIAGSAMAPLAGMLRERGFRVTGSDSGVIRRHRRCLRVRISFFNTFDAAHLQPAPDLALSEYHRARKSGAGGSAGSKDFLSLATGDPRGGLSPENIPLW